MWIIFVLHCCSCKRNECMKFMRRNHFFFGLSRKRYLIQPHFARHKEIHEKNRYVFHKLGCMKRIIIYWSFVKCLFSSIMNISLFINCSSRLFSNFLQCCSWSTTTSSKWKKTIMFAVLLTNNKPNYTKQKYSSIQIVQCLPNAYQHDEQPLWALQLKSIKGI